MAKQNFKFEGIDVPLRFITVHKDEASFLAQGKKQFFYDLPADQQEKLLKEMYKTGMDLKAANEAEEAQDKANKEQKPKQDPPPPPVKDKEKDKGNNTP